MKRGAVKALHDSRNQSCKQLRYCEVRFFRVDGVDASGQLIIRRQAEAALRADVLSEAAAVPRWHRSLRVFTLLVTRTGRAGAHGALDAAGLCEALRQAAEE